MRNAPKIIMVSAFAGLFTAQAGNLDDVGMTLLRATTTNLNGAGIRVGQPEAGAGPATVWEVNPSAVGQATNLFTYYFGNSSSVTTTNTFPNSLGVESGHADTVASYFYGMPTGIATNVSHVDNYEGNTFINYFIVNSRAISNRIVNQSFTFGTYDPSADELFDNYAAQFRVLFISGAAGPPVFSPASCYNGIGVGSAVPASPDGPTSDGRSKPDLIAPDVAETSYTAGQVSGAAAILLQAALRGDGGADTNSAGDIRTLKGLLLNGAVKPVDWTNSSSQPLHPHYGAGVLNIFNSYRQLAGGKRGYTIATTVATNTVHPPPGGVAGDVGALSGWDFTNVDSTHPNDGVNHYFLSVTNSTTNAAFTATATLVWNKQPSQASINNLNLFLYNAANSNLVACSTSLVDNVEHIYVPKLPQGRYDLQVWKAGGTTVSSNESYALAWEFFSATAGMTRSGTNAVLSWPVYPAGFVVEWTTNLTTAWTTNGLPAPTVTNNQNVIRIGVSQAGTTNQFFRLRRP